MNRQSWLKGIPRRLNWLEWGCFKGCERHNGYRGVVTLREEDKGYYWDVTHWNGKLGDDSVHRDIFTGYAKTIAEAKKTIELRLREIWNE